MEVPEIPREKEVLLPAKESAVIVVDMQNDFARRGGALFVEGAEKVIPAIARLLQKAREAGVRIVYTQDWHEPDDPEFRIWPVHCVQETEGAQIVDALKPQPGDHIVRKLRYDAFYGTDLDHYLRVHSIRHLVVTGTVSNICVLHTAGSAALRWYEIVVPEDAIGPITEFDQILALRQITFLYRGKVTTVDGVKFQ